MMYPKIFPIKTVPFIPDLSKKPEFLLYRAKAPNYDSLDSFTLYSIKEKKPKAYMTCKPSYIFRNGFNKPSLKVELLKSFDRDKGFGTMLIDFAKNLSFSMGCKGNVHLVASAAFDEYRAPHVFYRKMGFNTGMSLFDKEIDEYVIRGEDASCLYMPNVKMFFPPVPYGTTHTGFKGVIEKFLNWITR